MTRSNTKHLVLIQLLQWIKNLAVPKSWKPQTSEIWELPSNRIDVSHSRKFPSCFPPKNSHEPRCRSAATSPKKHLTIAPGEVGGSSGNTRYPWKNGMMHRYRIIDINGKKYEYQWPNSMKSVPWGPESVLIQLSKDICSFFFSRNKFKLRKKNHAEIQTWVPLS